MGYPDILILEGEKAGWLRELGTGTRSFIDQTPRYPVMFLVFCCHAFIVRILYSKHVGLWRERMIEMGGLLRHPGTWIESKSGEKKGRKGGKNRKRRK